MPRADALHRRTPVGPSTAVPDSHALASAAKGGDRDAFAELVRRYERRVYAYAWHHLHDAEEARDLSQEVFLRLFRGLPRFEAGRPFDAWFWRLVVNATIDHARRRVPAPVEAEPDVAGSWSPADSDLEIALAGLSPELRAPLLMHYNLGLPLETIAGALGATVPAVKSRMHRARAQLRQALAGA